MTRVGLLAAGLQASLRVRDVLLALREILDLFLQLLRRSRALLVSRLQLLDLELDQLLALRESSLGCRQLLLGLEGSVHLEEPLVDLPFALLELCLGGLQRRRATVEGRRLLGELLFGLHFAAGDLDLLVERRSEILLTGK